MNDYFIKSCLASLLSIGLMSFAYSMDTTDLQCVIYEESMEDQRFIEKTCGQYKCRRILNEACSSLISPADRLSIKQNSKRKMQSRLSESGLNKFCREDVAVKLELEKSLGLCQE